MHMLSINAGSLALVALTCATLAFGMIRLRRNGSAVFNGGILLAVGLLAAAALPVLSHLPWAALADEALDQAIAAAQFLEAAYVILTL